MKNKTERKGISNSKSSFIFSKKGIAIIASVLILVIGLSVGLVLFFTLNGSISSRLSKTKINMNGIVAFGLMQRDTRRTSKISASNFSTSASSSEMRSNLISVNQDGKVDDVIYEDIESGKSVMPNDIGYALNTYVGTEFTFVSYTNDEDRYKSFMGYHDCINTSFECDEKVESFAIHNETGKVYAMQTVMDELYAQTGMKFANFIAFDGVINVWGTHKLFIGADDTLQITSIIKNPNLSANNVLRDIHGNIYIYADGLDEKDNFDNVHFIKDPKNYYFGIDKRMYYISSMQNIKVLNQNAEQVEVAENVNTVTKNIEELSSSSTIVVLKDDYAVRISSGIAVYKKHAVSGEYRSCGAGGIIDNGFSRYHLIGGKVLLEKNNGNNNDVLYHIDITKLSQNNEAIEMHEIVRGRSDVYLTNEMNIIKFSKESIDGTKKYSVYVKSGEVICEETSSATYGGIMLSLYPLN